MTPLRITIPGEPIAWARSGQRGKFHYTPHRQAVAMDVIRLEASRAMAGRALLAGPLSVSALFVYAWPASWSERRKRTAGAHHKTSRPDADNLLKIVADSLNGIVWTDDAIMSRVIIEKQFGVRPMTVIAVEPLIIAEAA